MPLNYSSFEVEELTILNQNFIELVATEGYFKPLPVPPMHIGKNLRMMIVYSMKRRVLDLKRS